MFVSDTYYVSPRVFKMKIPFFKDSARVNIMDAISENNPRVIDDGRARKLASDLKRCTYFETCATYGLNVERVFHDACSKIVAQRLQMQGVTPNNSRPSTPTHLLRYPSTNNGYTPSQPYSTLPTSSHQVTPPLPGSSPSHVFTNTLTKDGLSHNTGAELTGMTRADSFRDESFKRVSAPGGVTNFMHPPPPPNANSTLRPHMDAMSTPNRDSSTATKDLPTPSSTPTTTRKSRRKSNLFNPAKKTDDKDRNRNGDAGKVGSGRAIPLKQGWLYKKSNKALNKDWKKKYVSLCDDGKLTYHPSLHDYMEDVHSKEISLQYTTVKVPGMKPRGSRVVGVDPLAAELNSLNLTSNSSNGPSLTGRASIGGSVSSKDKVTLTLYESLNDPSNVNGLDSPSLSSKIENQTPNVKKRHRRNKSSTTKNAECEDCDGYEFSIVSLDNKQWHFEANSQEERDEWVSAIEQQILVSLQTNESNKTKTRQAHPTDPQAITILKSQVPGNMYCVDCDAPNPEWASINLGVLMCIECSGIHRNLGSHISKVRSLDLDEWPPGPLSVMMALGNEFANSIWESRISSNPRPTPVTPHEEKEKWIRAKYEGKEFVCSMNNKMPLQEQLVECVCRGDVRGLASLLPHAGDSINAPLSPPRDMRTLLHLSSALPSLPCTQLLLWDNANVKVSDLEGRTCLYYARATGDKEIIDLLIQNGCPDTPTLVHPNNVKLSNPTQGGVGLTSNILPSTLPRRKGSISRKPEMLDKLQASVI